MCLYYKYWYIYNVAGDSSKPRAWSKYATDSSHNKDTKASNAKSKKASTDSSEESNVKSGEANEKNKKAEKKDDEEVRKALEKVEHNLFMFPPFMIYIIYILLFKEEFLICLIT